MVSVVVRDQDGRYVLIPKVQGFQFLLNTPDSHPGVYEDAGTGAQQKGTVAAAAAGKTHEPHHGRCSSSQYLPMTP